MSQAKNWVFTLNADETAGEHVMWPLATQQEHPLAGWVEPGAEMGVTFLCYQVEEGEAGQHIHLQGAVCFAKAKRLATLKKFMPRAHWEVMRGTPKEASDYCAKSTTRVCGPFVHGDCPDGQGARHDVTAVYGLVKGRKTNLEILEITQGRSAKLAKHIDYMRFNLMSAESDRQLQGVKVITLYGATGTGKTYSAVNLIAQGRDYFILTAPSARNSNLWFDGYQGQHILIIDDFSGDSVPFNYLLRLLDVYPMPVQIKGGFMWATWTLVVITTNTFPASWYTQVNTAPLRRRLTTRGSEIRLVEVYNAYKTMDWGENAEVDATAFAPMPQLPLAAPAVDAPVASPYAASPSAANAPSPDFANAPSPSGQVDDSANGAPSPFGPPAASSAPSTSTTCDGAPVEPFVPDHFAPAASTPLIQYLQNEGSDTEEDLDLQAADDGLTDLDVMIPGAYTGPVPTPPPSPPSPRSPGVSPLRSPK